MAKVHANSAQLVTDVTKRQYSSVVKIFIAHLEIWIESNAPVVHSLVSIMLHMYPIVRNAQLGNIVFRMQQMELLLHNVLQELCVVVELHLLVELKYVPLDTIVLQAHKKKGPAHQVCTVLKLD